MRSDQNKPNLPWWVELLFVQIGLPDSWLRTFLKSKKKSKVFVEENKKIIIVSLLTIGGLIYTNPIFKSSRIQNICIDASLDYVKDKIPYEERLNKKASLAWAIRFCNGGDIDSIN